MRKERKLKPKFNVIGSAAQWGFESLSRHARRDSPIGRGTAAIRLTLSLQLQHSPPNTESRELVVSVKVAGSTPARSATNGR